MNLLQHDTTSPPPHHASTEEFADTLNDVYGKFTVVENAFKTHAATWRLQSGAMLNSAEVTVAGLEVFRQQNALKSDYRDTVFVLLQLNGHQTIEHCNNRSLLRQGDIVFVGHKNGIRLSSDAPNRVLAAYLPLDLIRAPDIARDLYGKRFAGSNLRTQLFSDVLLRLSQPQASETAGIGDFGSTLLNVAWSGLVAENVARRRKPSVDRLEEYVLAHLDDPDLDVQTLSCQLGLSARTLYRRCQEQGLSPSAWLWRTRLNVAKERLRSPAWKNHSVTEISQSVGFNDSAHFSRSFKRAFGMSPKAWSKG